MTIERTLPSITLLLSLLFIFRYGFNAECRELVRCGGISRCHHRWWERHRPHDGQSPRGQRRQGLYRRPAARRSASRRQTSRSLLPSCTAQPKADAPTQRFGNIHPIQASVTSHDDLQRAVDYITAQDGHINLLINNAGIATPNLGPHAPRPKATMIASVRSRRPRRGSTAQPRTARCAMCAARSSASAAPAASGATTRPSSTAPARPAPRT